MKLESIGGRRGAARCVSLLVMVLVMAGCSSGLAVSPTPPGSDPAPGSTGALPVGSTPPADSATPGATASALPGTPVTPGTSAAPTLAPTAAATPPPPLYAWLAADLLDVRSGEILRPADLLGKLVVIEPMAIWCSNCRAQQNEARTAIEALGDPNLVYISLDVDPNESEADLARYADEREYPWHFAVASRDLARALVETFGDVVLSPPSTPKIVITPEGQVEISFGIKGAAELETELGALLP